MKPNDSVRVEMLVEVEPADAFEIFVEDVDVWWRRGVAYRVAGTRPSTMRFESGPEGRLLELWEDTVHVVGRVLTWSPPEHLRFEFVSPTFKEGERTEVDVRFEPSPSGTRVVLVHSGWDGVRPDHPVRHGLEPTPFLTMWGTWWTDHLRALRGRGAARRGA